MLKISQKSHPSCVETKRTQAWQPNKAYKICEVLSDESIMLPCDLSPNAQLCLGVETETPLGLKNVQYRFLESVCILYDYIVF